MSGCRGGYVLGQSTDTIEANLQPCKFSNCSRLLLTKVKIQQTKGKSPFTHRPIVTGSHFSLAAKIVMRKMVPVPQRQTDL